MIEVMRYLVVIDDQSEMWNGSCDVSRCQNETNRRLARAWKIRETGCSRDDGYYL